MSSAYELKYDQLEKWSYIDIALVKVESPYDFNDATYQVQCSYIPTTIPINYENKYQEPGTDAMVLGWGHKIRWRTVNEIHLINKLIGTKIWRDKNGQISGNGRLGWIATAFILSICCVGFLLYVWFLIHSYYRYYYRFAYVMLFEFCTFLKMYFLNETKISVCFL